MTCRDFHECSLWLGPRADVVASGPEADVYVASDVLHGGGALVRGRPASRHAFVPRMVLGRRRGQRRGLRGRARAADLRRRRQRHGGHSFRRLRRGAANAAVRPVPEPGDVADSGPLH